MKFFNIFHNSYNSDTDLCHIGCKYGTDKSPLIYKCPYNISGNYSGHAYTPLYNTLFSPLRYKKINFGEIGIYKNYSMKMWREYFPNANLYGWDCHPSEAEESRYKGMDFIEEAKKDNLYNTVYDYMNVRDEDSIINSLEKSNIKFDILIDDSDHQFWSQVRIIRNSYKFLNPGGMLIIEDVAYRIYEYFNLIYEYGHDKFYDTFTQVKTYHNNQSYGSDADELILLIRNGVEQ